MEDNPIQKRSPQRTQRNAEKKQNPTKEQWNEMEQQLRRAFGSVKLKVDGFNIGLSVRTNGMKLVICIFIDGTFKGAWLNGDCEEGRRFAAERRLNVFSEKERKLWIKLNGLTKSQAAKQKADKSEYYKQIISYYPWFTSFRALKSKLIKNNENIEVVSIGYVPE